LRFAGKSAGIDGHQNPSKILHFRVHLLTFALCV
jgi:hypothetical protein